MFLWNSFFLSMQKNSFWWPGFIFSKDKFKVRGLRVISGQEKRDQHQKIIMVICLKERLNSYCIWCFLIPHLPTQVSQCALFMDTSQITGFTASAMTRVTQNHWKNKQPSLGVWQRIRPLTLFGEVWLCHQGAWMILPRLWYVPSGLLLQGHIEALAWQSRTIMAMWDPGI